MSNDSVRKMYTFFSRTTLLSPPCFLYCSRIDGVYMRNDFFYREQSQGFLPRDALEQMFSTHALIAMRFTCYVTFPHNASDAYREAIRDALLVPFVRDLKDGVPIKVTWQHCGSTTPSHSTTPEQRLLGNTITRFEAHSALDMVEMMHLVRDQMAAVRQWFGHQKRDNEALAIDDYGFSHILIACSDIVHKVRDLSLITSYADG